MVSCGRVAVPVNAIALALTRLNSAVARQVVRMCDSDMWWRSLRKGRVGQVNTLVQCDDACLYRRLDTCAEAGIEHGF